MRNLAINLVIAALAALSSSANANVTYNWLTLTSNFNFTMFGQMVFDDQYWLDSDTFSFSSRTAEGHSGLSVTPPGLLSLYWGMGDGLDGSQADYRPSECSASRVDCLGGLLGKTVVYGTYDIDLALGSLLTGNLYVNDTQQNFAMASADSPVWTVETFRTDGPGPNACRTSYDCGGGTGLWVLDRNTIPVASPVPEPETYAMFLVGLGVVGIAGRRRLKRAA